MSAVPVRQTPTPVLPILLFDDECRVCSRIAAWVVGAARTKAGLATLAVRGIGEDPDALREIHPDLVIWDAYATVHVVMPDGRLKAGGEAVAEVFRRLPACRWFAWVFAVSLLGFHPAQRVLDFAYMLLADLRPVLGCDSCGTPSPWVRPLIWVRTRLGPGFPGHAPAPQSAHLPTPPAARDRPPSEVRP